MHNPKQQQSKDRSHFHMMLNAWEDELDPFQYRLLGHYARVAGEDGQCWEGVRKTSKRCKMSREKVISTRDELAKMGLIHVYRPSRDDHKSTLVIRVNYDWIANIRKYENGRNSERAGRDSVHPVTKVELTCSTNRTKEELDKNNQEEERAAGAAPATPGSFSSSHSEEVITSSDEDLYLCTF